MKQYNVGDSVWFAYYDMTTVEKTCPVCFGTKEVTLILGDNEGVVLPCDYCGRGLDNPRGFITEYEYVARAKTVIITKIQTETDTVGETRKYYLDGHFADINDLFESEEEALARCNHKIEHQQLEESTRAERLKADHLKSYGWNAGYHLHQAQEHLRKADYHKQKARLCKERAK